MYISCVLFCSGDTAVKYIFFCMIKSHPVFKYSNIRIVNTGITVLVVGSVISDHCVFLCVLFCFCSFFKAMYAYYRYRYDTEILCRGG